MAKPPKGLMWEGGMRISDDMRGILDYSVHAFRGDDGETYLRKHVPGLNDEEIKLSTSGMTEWIETNDPNDEPAPNQYWREATRL